MARIKELTGGLGAHSVVEGVGTQESMMQAIHAIRPGGHVGYVGVSHGVSLDGLELFFTGVHLHGGPAPVRRFLPELVDLTLPLEDAAEGYRAMDKRRATKVLLCPCSPRDRGRGRDLTSTHFVHRLNTVGLRMSNRGRGAVPAVPAGNT